MLRSLRPRYEATSLGGCGIDLDVLSVEIVVYLSFEKLHLSTEKMLMVVQLYYIVNELLFHMS